MAESSFARLGVLPGADARDIRRAYARALKTIDQAIDVDGFQRLRADYEAALAYGQLQDARTEADTTADDVPAGPAGPAASAEATSDQLADAVTETFCVAVASLVAKHGSRSSSLFEAALRHALADERLFGIEARLAFELRVAAMLANGWQPGHEALLVAAAHVFDWAHGAQRDSLGYAGAMIEQAMEERAMFDGQPAAEKRAQRRVLKMLRQSRMPAPGSVMQDLPFFERMQARFPCWLAIVAPQASLDYWAALVAGRHTLMPPPPGKTQWWLHIAMGCLCMLATMLFVHQSTLSPNLVSPPAGYEPVAQDRLDDIADRVDYRFTSANAHLLLAVTFEVTLDSGGRVARVDLVASSGNPVVDAAVKTSILHSAPFPPEIRRNFSFTFTHIPSTP